MLDRRFEEDPAGSVFPVAAPGETAINSNGVIAGWYDTPSTTHGFLTADGGSGCTQLDYPGAPNTEIHGINTQGNLVGLYYDDDGSNLYGLFAMPK